MTTATLDISRTPAVPFGRLVRVELRLPQGDGRRWPPLLAGPGADLPFVATK